MLYPGGAVDGGEETGVLSDCAEIRLLAVETSWKYRENSPTFTPAGALGVKRDTRLVQKLQKGTSELTGKFHSYSKSLADIYCMTTTGFS